MKKFFLITITIAVAACAPGEPAGETPPAEEPLVAQAPEVLMAAPDLAGVELVDQTGEAVVFEELRGRPTLLTFIYTRCPMPEMCPATTLRFQEVQKALAPEQREQVRLVSISFDPFDTPEVLAEYGDLWEVDGSFWHLLTGTEEAVHRVASSYGVWYEKADDVEAFNHPMYSMVLFPDGALHQVLLGSVWDSEEIAGVLLGLVDRTGTPPR